MERSVTKFVVVAGGVISGVGKGVTTASIGKILKEYGYRVTLIKIDPYINFDAGTLRPTEHGEVWVTEDGGEIDQDLGTYERFLNEDVPKQNNITTGQIYKVVIDRERRGEYLGQTVQFIPHITDEIVSRIKKATKGYDIGIIEIGGTVGDHENVPFLLAIKSIERELGSNNVAYVLVTYLPVPKHIGEMKTKPTQQAIRLLGEHGIMPDFIVCRGKYVLDEVRRKKIEEFAHIKSDHIIAAPDVTSIYEVPLNFEKEQLGKKILHHLSLEVKQKPQWDAWHRRVGIILNPKQQVRIAIVGKYLDIGDYGLTDSYLSIYHALIHAGVEQHIGITINWLDSKDFEDEHSVMDKLASVDGIIVPGGFGNSGIEGKINVISYVRKQQIPYLGLCYGLQLSVVEFALNVCNLKGAHTLEVDPKTPHPVITLLPIQKQVLKENNYGGTMRLGVYSARIKPNTQVAELYKKYGYETNAIHLDNEFVILERHRHRYEVNPDYVDQLTKQGIVFSGYHKRDDGTKLMEFIELPSHPFFIATQAHPEFKSRFGSPSPLFYGFVRACQLQADLHKVPNVVVEGGEKVQEAL